MGTSSTYRRINGTQRHNTHFTNIRIPPQQILHLNQRLCSDMLLAHLQKPQQSLHNTRHIGDLEGNLTNRVDRLPSEDGVDVGNVLCELCDNVIGVAFICNGGEDFQLDALYVGGFVDAAKQGGVYLCVWGGGECVCGGSGVCGVGMGGGIEGVGGAGGGRWCT